MRKIKWSILLLLFIGFIPLFDLFHSGLPVTHDGQDHVARIANFYQNLSEGNFIPRWAGNLNWGYGHPILMFLYPLPSYTASFFHFLGLSLIDSTKIVFGIAFLLSGLTMYLWIKNVLGIHAGVIAGILYMFAPYRFVDLYVRGAIGEHVAFIFPPLICYFIYKLSKKYSHLFIVGGGLSVAGLLLSHNAISIIFMPLIFLYTLYLSFTSEEPKSLLRQVPDGTWLRHLRGGTKSLLGGVGLIMLLGFGLSAFFWIPAFFEGKYTLRDIVTKGEYESRFTDFTHFVYSPWNYGGSGQFSLQVGIVHWAILVLAIPVALILYRRKDNLWILGSVTFLIFWLTIFLMTPASKLIWEHITVLAKFQFPWRFMSVTVFSTAVLGGLLVWIIPKRFKLPIVFCLTVLVFVFNKDYWHTKGYLYKEDSFFTGIYNGTTDTGESSPIWSVRFMLARPRDQIEVIEGNAKIRAIKRLSTKHVYLIDASKKTRLRENTLYFPGWNVFVDDKKTEIEFQDPANRGLMTFFVEKGKHEITAQFKETKLREIANTVSIGGLIALLMLGLLSKRKNKLPS